MEQQDWPITGVVVVADIGRCPAGFTTVIYQQFFIVLYILGEKHSLSPHYFWKKIRDHVVSAFESCVCAFVLMLYPPRLLVQQSETWTCLGYMCSCPNQTFGLIPHGGSRGGWVGQNYNFSKHDHVAYQIE